MATRVSSPTFVGRRRELDEATAALDLAREGRSAAHRARRRGGGGQDPLRAGGGGRARDSGFRVLARRLRPAWRRRPAVRPDRRGVCATSGIQFSPEQFDELLGAGRADLARLMPAHFDRQINGAGGAHRSGRARTSVRAPPAVPAPTQPTRDRWRWSSRTSIGPIARRWSCWGSWPSNLHERPIVLVATYRSDEIHRRHPLLPLLASAGARWARRAARARPGSAGASRPTSWRASSANEPDPDLVDAIYAALVGTPSSPRNCSPPMPRRAGSRTRCERS